MAMRGEHGSPGGGEAGADAEYESARLARELTTAVSWYMDEHGVSKRELARRLEVTPGRVSQILSGGENLTLRTLATVCAALDARLQIELVANKPGGPAHGRFGRA